LVTVPLLFQLALVGFVAIAEKKKGHADRLFLHTKEVMGQAQRVSTLLADAAAGSRGYLLTGDPAFAVPYQRAAGALYAALHRLQALVDDNAEQAARACRLTADAGQFLEWQAESIRFMRQGDPERAVDRVRTPASNIQSNALRNAIDAFLMEEQRLDDERTLAAHRSQQRLHGLLLGGTAISILTTALLALKKPTMNTNEHR
jgi:CHASE3 domain sensor protein